MLIEQFERLGVVFGQLDLLPQLGWQMSSFDCFHVQIAVAFVLAHGCIPSVGERATVAGTQASQVVLVATKSLSGRPIKSGQRKNALLTWP